MKELRFSVGDILGSDEIASRAHDFEVAQSAMEGIELPVSLAGRVDLVRIDEEQVLAHISVSGQVKANCDRCLKPFDAPIDINFDQIFSSGELDEDQLAIDKNLTIDLMAIIVQEIEISLPMKWLCKDNCPGIKVVVE